MSTVAVVSAAETLCTLLAFAGLAYALLHSGGRANGSTQVALAATVPSLIAGRVWRNVPAFELVIASLIAATAVLVPLVTPLGVSYAADLGAYTYASVLFVAVRGYARDSERRRIVAVGLVGLAILEFPDVWRVWVGENNPSFQLVGTFYWHNQFGIYAAVTALIATAMAMRSRRLEDGIAWLVAPLCLALTVLSGSRGAELSLAIGTLALLGVVLAHRQWRALMLAVVVGALAFVTHLAFAAAVGSSTSAPITLSNGVTTARETTAAAGHFRRAVTEASLQVFAHAPAASHGYGSLAVQGWHWTAAGTTPAAWAHSAELQALSDGGLLLGVPVLLALAVITLLALRTLRNSVRAPVLDWVRTGAVAALLAMLVHTSIDFDTQYAALTAMLAVLVALTLPEPSSVAHRSRGSRALAVCAVGAAVVSAGVGAAMVSSNWHTTDELSSAAATMPADSARGVALARDALNHHSFTDPRPAEYVVEAADIGYVFDDATLQRALGQSRDYARVDTVFASVWDRVSAGRDAARATPP